jgi:hypothetical protein
MSRRAVALTLTISLLTACATTGATYRSGVGDRMVSRAPFYAGATRTPVAANGVRVGVLPVVFQPRDGANEIFDPSSAPASPMAALLTEMNAFLDSLTAFNGSVPVRVEMRAAAGTPPDVRFGCLTEGDLPGEDCVARGDSVLGRIDNLQQLKLSVGRPSAAWVASAAAAMDSAEIAHALVITLEVGEYWLRQTGLSGRKSVELGTNYIVSQPWMTSLETPIPVLQFTGALVDREGKAVRFGAEGILAKRTRLLASGFGLQALITDEDVESARTLRRSDLPGQPLAWQESLRQLVHGLTK